MRKIVSNIFIICQHFLYITPFSPYIKIYNSVIIIYLL